LGAASVGELQDTDEDCKSAAVAGHDHRPVPGVSNFSRVSVGITLLRLRTTALRWNVIAPHDYHECSFDDDRSRRLIPHVRGAIHAHVWIARAARIHGQTAATAEARVHGWNDNFTRQNRKSEVRRDHEPERLSWRASVLECGSPLPLLLRTAMRPGPRDGLRLFVRPSKAAAAAAPRQAVS